MARHYGIPYMGSKQKLVDKFIPFIVNRHPGVTHFYDLFGGGASIALYAVRKYPKISVHYNELSNAVGGLLQYLKDGGDIPFDFIPRQDFERDYTREDWYGGLLQTCWTFGNNQKSYLYGLRIEEFKQEATKLVMTGKGNIDFLEQFNNEYVDEMFKRVDFNTRIYMDSKRYKTPYQRRIVLNRQLPELGPLQHMARLERLKQIQQMPSLQRLNITSGKTYKEVNITGKNIIVYCDPPYENTAEYKEGGFDHKEFYEWVMTRTFPVYLSSYKISDPRLKLIKAVKTRSLLASAYTDKASYNYEKLYWNGVV